eukprot:1156375-Pelagomonas_calceolata.AAC.6
MPPTLHVCVQALPEELRAEVLSMHGAELAGGVEGEVVGAPALPGVVAPAECGIGCGECGLWVVPMEMTMPMTLRLGCVGKERGDWAVRCWPGAAPKELRVFA